MKMYDETYIFDKVKWDIRNYSVELLIFDDAHGCHDTSIRMVKMCDDSIAYSLKIIFEPALKSGIYPDKWK